jgi:hypothetical protein
MIHNNTIREKHGNVMVLRYRGILNAVKIISNINYLFTQYPHIKKLDYVILDFTEVRWLHIDVNDMKEMRDLCKDLYRISALYPKTVKVAIVAASKALISIHRKHFRGHAGVSEFRFFDGLEEAKAWTGMSPAGDGSRN